jgi:exosortase
MIVLVGQLRRRFMNLLQQNVFSPRPKSTESAHWSAKTRGALWAAGILLVALLWSYWTTLAGMADRWARDPQYSHGFVVPVFALVVLWFRRDMLAKATWSPCLWGLPILLGGVAVRLFAIRRDIEPLDAFSLVPTAFGLVLLVAGRSVLRWSWPALAFLTFMVPLPYFMEMALAQPLRRLATTMSAYVLQTCGYAAIAEGNVILIDQMRLGVADACSGLGMLTTFIALATALALVVRAPLTDRIVLVVSAVPIALIANVARIAAMGITYQALGSETTQAALHDVTGWLMMPFALMLLWLELRFLNKLLMPRPVIDAPPPLFTRERTKASTPALPGYKLTGSR